MNYFFLIIASRRHISMLRSVAGATVSFGGVNNGTTYMVMRCSWVSGHVRNGMAARLGAGMDPMNAEPTEAIKGGNPVRIEALYRSDTTLFYAQPRCCFGVKLNNVFDKRYQGMNLIRKRPGSCLRTSCLSFKTL